MEKHVCFFKHLSLSRKYMPNFSWCFIVIEDALPCKFYLPSTHDSSYLTPDFTSLWSICQNCLCISNTPTKIRNSKVSESRSGTAHSSPQKCLLGWPALHAVSNPGDESLCFHFFICEKKVSSPVRSPNIPLVQRNEKMLVSVLKLEAEDVMQENSNFINCCETANVELKSMLLSPEQKLTTATKRHS